MKGTGTARGARLALGYPNMKGSVSGSHDGLNGSESRPWGERISRTRRVVLPAKTGDDNDHEEVVVGWPDAGGPGIGDGRPDRMPNLAPGYGADPALPALSGASAAVPGSLAAVPAITGAGLAGASCRRRSGCRHTRWSAVATRTAGASGRTWWRTGAIATATALIQRSSQVNFDRGVSSNGKKLPCLIDTRPCF